MERADYEWHYYIGGDCALKRRKVGAALAYIYHLEQGIYEPVLIRNTSWDGLTEDVFSLGIFNDSNEAQEVVEQALLNHWDKS